jgi:hypothetical protein
MSRTPFRETANGFFGTERWRQGEHVRERFTLAIPADWKGDAIAVGLVASDSKGEKASATGAAPSNDAELLVLGTLPMAGSVGKAGP